jgi:hypothetical protein
MLLFKMLILAHLVADFPLQTALIYRLKKRYLAGQLPHAMICFVTMAIAGYPLVGYWSFWCFIFLMACIHLAVDYFKLTFLDRMYSGNNLWTFLLDQAMHVSAIATVFLTSLPLSPALGGSLLARLDRSGAITVAIFFLVATFGGVYLIDSARRTFSAAPNDGRVPDAFEKYYGIAERGVLFALMLAGYWGFALVPVVLFVRLPMANHCAKKFQERKFLLSPGDIIGSLLIAAAAAVCTTLTR